MRGGGKHNRTPPPFPLASLTAAHAGKTHTHTHTSPLTHTPVTKVKSPKRENGRAKGEAARRACPAVGRARPFFPSHPHPIMSHRLSFLFYLAKRRPKHSHARTSTQPDTATLEVADPPPPTGPSPPPRKPGMIFFNPASFPSIADPASRSGPVSASASGATKAGSTLML